jgi:hypothetical protein
LTNVVHLSHHLTIPASLRSDRWTSSPDSLDNFAGISKVNGRIGILQQAVVRCGEIAIAFRQGDTRAEACPLRREQWGNATIEPVDLCSPGGSDAAEDNLCDAVRVSLGVREPQGRASRTAKEQPLVNLQVLSQLLQIRQEMCRRIDRKIGAQVTGVR